MDPESFEVLLIDDDQVVPRCLRRMPEAERDLEVIAQAGNQIHSPKVRTIAPAPLPINSGGREVKSMRSQDTSGQFPSDTAPGEVIGGIRPVRRRVVSFGPRLPGSTS